MAGMTYEAKINLVKDHLPGTVTEVAEKSGLSTYKTKDTLARMSLLGLARKVNRVRAPSVWYSNIGNPKDDNLQQGSSVEEHRSHNPKDVGSTPTPAPNLTNRV